ncbi:hypothetical protein EI94DRAFT_1779712 [Lactarius quietus]|nr:hypothetical protein EI94DRAFT_1779712 [Lactarius quietus]
MYTSAVIILAVGASYAAVPLYRMFCAATGFAGHPSSVLADSRQSASCPLKARSVLKYTSTPTEASNSRGRSRLSKNM